jgi:hypothetical protein
VKVRQWHEEDRLEREADERRHHGRRWIDDSMDVDGKDEDADELSEESEEEEESNYSIAHPAPNTYVSFSFFIRFFY